MLAFARTAAAAVLLATALVPAAPPPAGAETVVPAGDLTEATVETGTGVYPFVVEVADDPAERALGLMHRREIPPERGMLFDMGETRPVGFWMKNTFVSLDIIFLDEGGRVIGFAERTEPLSERIIESGAPVRYVLELVAGTARRIGLEAGDRVRHPIIPAS